MGKVCLSAMEIPLCALYEPPLACWWRRNQTLELIILSQLLFAYLSTFHHQWLHAIFYRERENRQRYGAGVFIWMPLALIPLCPGSQQREYYYTLERQLFEFAARFIKSGGGAAATGSAPPFTCWTSLNILISRQQRQLSLRACTFRTESNGELRSPLDK